MSDYFPRATVSYECCASVRPACHRRNPDQPTFGASTRRRGRIRLRRREVPLEVGQLVAAKLNAFITNLTKLTPDSLQRPSVRILQNRPRDRPFSTNRLPCIVPTKLSASLLSREP